MKVILMKWNKTIAFFPFLRTLSVLIIAVFFSTSSHAQYIISTVAGVGTRGYSGDGGPATLAAMHAPAGITVDRFGNVFVAEGNNVSKVDVAGNITTYAGISGITIYAGDGVPATATGMVPIRLAIDTAGNLYIADPTNYRILKVNAATGIITTVVGNGTPGHGGDGGPATAAQFSVIDIAIDTAGSIYFTDSLVIRKADAVTGIVTRVVGSGINGFSGDGGPATAANTSVIDGISLDASGNLYFNDYGNYRTRMVNPAGIITTIAGNGTNGYSGDGGPATAAQIGLPYALLVDGNGDVYLTDRFPTDRIRKINTSGIITTVAGTGTNGYSGDGGPATAANIFGPCGITRYGRGNIYFSDYFNYRVRMLSNIPYYVHGHLQNALTCADTLILNSQLSTADSTSGMHETWSLISGSFHGTAHIAYTTTTTGGTITPSGQYYIPTPGYTGMDTIIASVTDGIVADTTTIYITVQSKPVVGTITGMDTVCRGDTVMLSDTTAGGTWSSSNAIASVSATGRVTGIATGSAVISYRVTYSCGTLAATHTITVKNCNVGVHSVKRPGKALTISPNPNSGGFTVMLSSPIAETVRISIADPTGRKLKEITTETNKPTAIHADAPPGVYIVTAATAHGTWNEKIVVH
jgi:hypothetical protein